MAGEAHHRVAGETRTGEGSAESPGQSANTGCHARDRIGSAPLCCGCRGGEAHDAGDALGAAASTSLLTASGLLSAQEDAGADDQPADTDRSASLVGAQAEEIDTQFVKAEG